MADQYDTILETMRSRWDAHWKRDDIDWSSEQRRVEEFIDSINRKFPYEQRTGCALVHLLIGSTTDRTNSPNVDLPGNIIQKFIEELSAGTENK